MNLLPGYFNDIKEMSRFEDNAYLDRVVQKHLDGRIQSLTTPTNRRFQSTVTVGPGRNQGNDFSDIQQAVDYVYNKLGGGLIYLKNHTYTLDAPIKSYFNISFIGESKENVVIDFQNLANGFIIPYSYLHMMDDWGTAGDADSDLNNDGIVSLIDFSILMFNWPSENTPVSFENLTIKNSKARGAIRAAAMNSLVVRDCAFENNLTDIEVEAVKTLDIERNRTTNSERFFSAIGTAQNDISGRIVNNVGTGIKANPITVRTTSQSPLHIYANEFTADTATITHSVDVEKSSSQYLSITDAAQTGLDITGDFTIEGWIKPEALLTAGQIFILVAKWSGTNQRAYILELEDDQRLNIYYSSDGGATNVTRIRSTNAFIRTIDVGRWVHFMVEVDVSAASANFYRNSEPIATSVVSSLATSVYSGTAPVEVLGASGGSHFDGKAKNFRIWSGMMGANHALNYFTRSTVGDEAGLLADWKFNNNYNDDTANNNDLTANNSPVFSSGDVPLPLGIVLQDGNASMSVFSNTLTSFGIGILAASPSAGNGLGSKIYANKIIPGDYDVGIWGQSGERLHIFQNQIEPSSSTGNAGIVLGGGAYMMNTSCIGNTVPQGAVGIHVGDTTELVMVQLNHVSGCTTKITDDGNLTKLGDSGNNNFI